MGVGARRHNPSRRKLHPVYFQLGLSRLLPLADGTKPGQLPVAAIIALRAVPSHFAVGTAFALCTGTFLLPMRAGIALEAALLALTVGARIAARAEAPDTTMWTGLALCTRAFQLAMRATIALQAANLTFAVRARITT